MRVENAVWLGVREWMIPGATYHGEDEHEGWEAGSPAKLL